jgi:hypothetical protein
MTISFKKINSMIDSEVSIQKLSEQQKKVLRDLCAQIYTIESSLDKGGSHQIVSEIKGEISLKADDFQE